MFAGGSPEEKNFPPCLPLLFWPPADKLLLRARPALDAQDLWAAPRALVQLSIGSLHSGCQRRIRSRSSLQRDA
jgi:hypothetical protein